jgi:glycosyltransferase involved in cell wall biosynthesis
VRILFLSRWYPYPPDNGSKLRVHGLLQGLCERHDVTLISFIDGAETPGQPPSPGPSEIKVCQYREYVPTSSRAILGFMSGTPRFLVDTHSPEMSAHIREAVRSTRFDLVIASQLSMAAYYDCFRGIPAIFEEAELGGYRPRDSDEESRWTQARRRVTWAKHINFMSRLLHNFEFCTVASDIERQLLAEAVPGYVAVHVVPNSVSAGAPNGAGERVPGSLIFTGSLRYGPNRDAMTWFADEIFPLVREKDPGIRLSITGDIGPDPPALGPNVVLTGHVPDVRALVGAAAVSVAPIRLGGGTRLKILEAMAVGTPVVATPRAAEGLDARHGEHLLVAETPRAFAGAVHQLLADPAGARAMAERARHLFHSRYDSRVVVAEFLRLVEDVVAA